jgi:hypothetical protein
VALPTVRALRVLTAKVVTTTLMVIQPAALAMERASVRAWAHFISMP